MLAVSRRRDTHLFYVDLKLSTHRLATAQYIICLLLQSKTFACNFDGRPSGLVIDLRQGFSLYDIPTKVDCVSC